MPRNILGAGLLFLSACSVSHTGDDAGGPPDGSLSRDGSALPDGSLPGGCIVGTAVACECPDAPPGFRFCLAEEGVLGGCECSPPSPADLDGGAPVLDGSVDGSVGPCAPDDDEWCDGRDNDCNGLVDDGHVCPDATIANTLPHDLVVWMRGNADDGRTRALQRFWPDPGGELIPIPGASALRFDHAGALFYQRADVGVRRYVGAGLDEEVETPPCFDGVGHLFGFDETNRMYYACGLTLRRGAGELVHSSSSWFGTVLGSGRQMTIDSVAEVFFVRDTDGTELSRFPADEWAGTMRVIWPTVTVVGDSGFIAFNRIFRGSTRREIVIYRVDGDGTWRLVRRIPTTSWMHAGIALPDGTFIGVRVRDASVVAFSFPPSGLASVLRRDGSGYELHFEVGELLDAETFVAGPRSL